jgi:hypothetical protein
MQQLLVALAGIATVGVLVWRIFQLIDAGKDGFRPLIRALGKLLFDLGLTLGIASIVALFATPTNAVLITPFVATWASWKIEREAKKPKAPRKPVKAWLTAT